MKAALAALWAVVILFSGWLWTVTENRAIASATELARVRADQQMDRERIATLEEAARNIRESLKRIEDGVNTISRDRRR